MAEDQSPEISIDPSAIDELLKQAGMPSDTPAATSEPPPSSASSPSPSLDAVAAGGDAFSLDQASIDELLQQASFEDPSAIDPRGSAAQPAADGGAQAAAPPVPDAGRFDFPSFQQVMQDAQVSSIDLLRDVELNVKI